MCVIIVCIKLLWKAYKVAQKCHCSYSVFRIIPGVFKLPMALGSGVCLSKAGRSEAERCFCLFFSWITNVLLKLFNGLWCWIQNPFAYFCLFPSCDNWLRLLGPAAPCRKDSLDIIVNREKKTGGTLMFWENKYHLNSKWCVSIKSLQMKAFTQKGSDFCSKHRRWPHLSRI